MNHVKTEEQVQYQARPKLRRFAIGIDGGTATGFAVWDRVNKEFEDIQSLNFWTAYHLIVKKYEVEETEIFIEDPSQNKPVFIKRYDPKTVRTALKIAQDVGGVKKESEKLAEGLELAGFEVKKIRPSSAKWTDKHFKQVSQYKGSTSQHARDAARLVIGR